MSVGLEIGHERLVTSDGGVGTDGIQVLAVRSLYAQAGGQRSDEALALDLAEISGVPPEAFLGTDPGSPIDRMTHPERVLVEDPPVSMWRPYANGHEIDDKDARYQVEALAHGPDPPKTERPKQATTPENTESPVGAPVLAGTTADRIQELRRFQALHGLPETSSGIDVMARFHEAVAAEVPQILLDMTSAGHVIEEVRVEVGKFQALAKLIVRKMVNPDRQTLEAYDSPLEAVAEQQVASRGVWRAVTGRLKRLTAALRQ